MKVTSHRLPNGHHELRDESGVVIGRAWRWPRKSRGYGMSLTGVYWRSENKFNTTGGTTTTSCRTLGHCRDKASTVLDWVRAEANQATHTKEQP
jgi:hypothetical protein